MIPEGSRVLDLGCGAGDLLKVLRIRKNAKVTGVEVDQQKLSLCVAQGVPVIHASLDTDLGIFSDKTFDFVILSRTIQSVQRPDLVLQQMLRIGKFGIISFMNFGHINSRVPLILGKMPVNKNLPRPWYDNQTIHPGTIYDMRDLFRLQNIKVLKEIYLSNEGDFLPFLGRIWPNLFASNCIFVIKK